MLNDNERARISLRHELPMFRVQVSILVVVNDLRGLKDVEEGGGLQIACLSWI